MLETLETPVHTPEKKLVLKAIEDSPGKVSVAEIATKTSLPVLKANGLLNQIAYETGAHLTVGTAGSVVYEFDRNFQTSYLSRSSKNFFLRLWRIIYNGSAYLLRLFTLAMFFVIRVSFGIILVLSIVLVVVLIVVAVVALLAKLMGSDNDSGPDIDFSGIFGGLGGIFRYWAFDWLWDWWYWGSYIRWDPTPQYREIPQDRKSQIPQDRKNEPGKKDKESFLDKCFSYLFGDGDPNQGLELRYWQNVGLALKANNGVMVAEQLAPYALGEGKNEDWVLPILVRFNGNCDVSENGNIIYSFPGFQQRLDTSKSIETKSKSPEELHQLFESYLKKKQIKQENLQAVTHLEPYLKEQPWQLSHISAGSRITIISLALFILVGSLWLCTMGASIPIILAFQPLLVAIAAYGAMFLLIPAIRMLFIQKKNAEIEKRNSIRYTALNKLQNADSGLNKKLSEAEEARAAAIKTAQSEEVVYTTERDALEQQFEQELDK